MPAPKGNKNAVGNKGGGAPSKFRPQFCEQAKMACEAGFTDRELAALFGVGETTINAWKLEHVEFAQALKTGKFVADNRVERSLYNRAVGYSFDAIKIMAVAGEVQKVEYVEHVPPDTTAQIFWLKNRQPDKWRDVHKHEVGAPGEFSNRTDDELRNIILEHAGELGDSGAGGDGTKPPPDSSALH